MNEKTTALGIAQEILRTSLEIPAIPDNMSQIFKVMRQPVNKIDIPEFAHFVESDPGLFTRVLQLANSPYYCETAKIVTLRAAITRIGLEQAIDTVCLGIFQKILPRFPDIQGFSYHDFWSFSWASAVAARRLGHPALGMDVVPGDLYVAGMLQGLGRLLFAIHFSHEFTTCVERAKRLGCPLCEVEKDIFGTTDGLVAARVLKAWNLPVNICESVGYCHMPEQAKPDYILMAGLVQFACAIAGHSNIGASGDGTTSALADTFLGQKTGLAIGRQEVQADLLEEICGQLSVSAQVMFPKACDPENKTSNRRPDKIPGACGRGADPATGGQHRKKGLFAWVSSLR